MQDPDYGAHCPTPELIAERAAAIRNTWTPAKEKLRRGDLGKPPLTIETGAVFGRLSGRGVFHFAE